MHFRHRQTDNQDSEQQRRSKFTDLALQPTESTRTNRLKTCDEEFQRSAEEPRKTGLQHGHKLFQLVGDANNEVVVCEVVLGHLQRPLTAHLPAAQHTHNSASYPQWDNKNE